MPKKDIPTYRLSDDELMGYLAKLVDIPTNILAHPQAVQRMLRLFRADIELSETIPFSAEPPFDCPLAVFGGRQDTAVRLEHLTPWSKHTTGTFTLQCLPGGHMFLESQREALLRQVAVVLKPLIDEEASGTEWKAAVNARMPPIEATSGMVSRDHPQARDAPRASAI